MASKNREEFTRLRRYIFFGHKDKTAMIMKFLRGLKPKVSSRLLAVTFTNLDELIEKAVNIEEVIKVEQEMVSQGQSSNNAGSEEVIKQQSRLVKRNRINGREIKLTRKVKIQGTWDQRAIYVGK